MWTYNELARLHDDIGNLIAEYPALAASAESLLAGVEGTMASAKGGDYCEPCKVPGHDWCGTRDGMVLSCPCCLETFGTLAAEPDPIDLTDAANGDFGSALPARPESGQDRQPAITRVSDAEIRVFPQEAGTDDASDMYAMEVLGTTVRVRLVREDDGDPDFPPRTLAKIMIEAGGVFIVGVNEDENVYGDAADEDWAGE